MAEANKTIEVIGVGQEVFAQVAVDEPIEGELTYRVPGEWVREVVVGSRVKVPLGRGNRVVMGTVVGLAGEAPRFEVKEEVVRGVEKEGELFAVEEEVAVKVVGGIKEIAGVERDVLPVPGDLLGLAKWISGYYCAPIGTTLSAMVPAAVKKATRIPAVVMVAWEEMRNAKCEVRKEESGKEEMGDERMEGMSARAVKAVGVVKELLAGGEMEEREVMAGAGVSRPMLKKMVDRGILRLERRLLNPLPAEVSHSVIPVGHVLSVDQQRALEGIESLIAEQKFAVRLIHGVTGSGKTELYIRAIEHVVARGKRAIVLVPEISLTPQTVRRFTQRFSRVAVLHSGLKDSERHQHWHAIASGWAQVIVGARSAIFAPAADIGLIVVDEEHDPSYKQDNAPRYHGRDVAIRRGQMLGVPVLLGSATPALESWHNAHGNPHYGLLTLATRPLGMQMPKVLTVDMKGESKVRRGLHILSTVLEHHLKATLEKGKQAIFLLNRRGYAHYVSCPRCDWVLMCENCDATMVVHRTKGKGERGEGKGEELGRGGFSERYGKVQCHYCSTAMVLPTNCPVCQAKVTHLGQGTQRAEDELVRKFPGMRLARMDSDSMGSQADYHRTLAAFGAGELDLLIGTQMIAKGLDFPNVTLVGVLNADLAMTIPDFRAAERTFQLICQVAGRAGRPGSDDGRGTVVVQTFQPQEPAIERACHHDYLGFVEGEMGHRKAFGYPPFGRMVRIVMSHKGFTKVHGEAAGLMKQIEEICERYRLPVRWQGPQPPPMERLVELYRVEIILFAETAGPLQKLLAVLRGRRALVAGQVGMSVDVDPVHMM